MEYILCRNNWSHFNFRRESWCRQGLSLVRAEPVQPSSSLFLWKSRYTEDNQASFAYGILITDPIRLEIVTQCFLHLPASSLNKNQFHVANPFLSPLNEKQKNFCAKRPWRKVGNGKQFGHYLLLINLLILFINYFFLGGLPFFQVNH